MKSQCLLGLLIFTTVYCYVEKAYDGEPSNHDWFMGEKERDGKKLFVPGDVVESDQLQKRTASYAIQSLVMGVRSDGKAYNSARYNVEVPKPADNMRRGLSLTAISKRSMEEGSHRTSRIISPLNMERPQESVEEVSTPSIVKKTSSPSTTLLRKEDNSIRSEKAGKELKSSSSIPMSRYYHMDLDSHVAYIKYLHPNEGDEVVNLTEMGKSMNTQTTNEYFGEISTMEYDVSLTLQTTDIRLNYLPMFLDRWAGPISVVVHCHPSHIEDILSFFQTASFPNRLILTMVTSSSDDYPINTLRNIAIEAAPTSHFMVFDMDVWPTASLYSSVMQVLHSDTEEGIVFRKDLTAVIIPVYEYTNACSSHETCVKEKASRIPHDKSSLRTCLSRHRCRQFREGQNLHNYYFPEWLEDDYNRTLTPVHCFVKDKQEPYLIVKKTNKMPRFDERFVNYGYNKVQWITHLRFTGYHFYVFGPAFGVDVAHPRGKLQKAFLSKMKTDHVVMNQALYQQFMNEKVYRNKRKSVLKGCRKNEPEVCLSCAVDY